MGSAGTESTEPERLFSWAVLASGDQNARFRALSTAEMRRYDPVEEGRLLLEDLRREPWADRSDEAVGRRWAGFEGLSEVLLELRDSEGVLADGPRARWLRLFVEVVFTDLSWLAQWLASAAEGRERVDADGVPDPAPAGGDVMNALRLLGILLCGGEVERRAVETMLASAVDDVLAIAPFQPGVEDLLPRLSPDHPLARQWPGTHAR